jgi:molybdenum-dependent DNA-binding transcriptional regulator ModE
VPVPQGVSSLPAGLNCGATKRMHRHISTVCRAAEQAHKQALMLLTKLTRLEGRHARPAPHAVRRQVRHQRRHGGGRAALLRRGERVLRRRLRARRRQLCATARARHSSDAARVSRDSPATQLPRSQASTHPLLCRRL